ncbi:MAG: hypothetical protein ABIH72_06015 [archaeon]
MEFTQAYRAIVKASKEKNTKEIPTILSCFDFENLNCLEIGPGPDARLAIKISGFPNHITLLTDQETSLLEIEKIIIHKKLDKKIKVEQYNSKSKKLPFESGSFDLIYGGWLPHKLVTDKIFLDEVSRISKKYLLFILPGIKGNEPELISIQNKNEKERRINYRKIISDYLLSKGFKITYKENILRLDFKDAQEIKEVFYCLAFKNKVSEFPEEVKGKIDEFLEKKVHNFQDGFYCIIAEKTK